MEVVDLILKSLKCCNILNLPREEKYGMFMKLNAGRREMALYCMIVIVIVILSLMWVCFLSCMFHSVV